MTFRKCYYRPLSPTPSPQPSPGGRGGWQQANSCAAALALLLLVPVPSIGVAMGMVIAPGRPLGTIVFALSKAWILVLPVLWLWVVERERPSFQNFPRPTARGWPAALGSGLLIAGVILAGNALVGRAWIDLPKIREVARRTGLDAPVLYLLGAGYWCFINALLEEYVWRWFVLRQCKTLLGKARGWRGGLAVGLAALGFTLHHILALAVQFDWRVTVAGSVGVFVGGVVWGWLYRRYDSIWPGYFSHVLADLAIFVLGWFLIVA